MRRRNPYDVNVVHVHLLHEFATRGSVTFDELADLLVAKVAVAGNRYLEAALTDLVEHPEHLPFHVELRLVDPDRQIAGAADNAAGYRLPYWTSRTGLPPLHVNSDVCRRRLKQLEAIFVAYRDLPPDRSLALPYEDGLLKIFRRWAEIFVSWWYVDPRQEAFTYLHGTHERLASLFQPLAWSVKWPFYLRGPVAEGRWPGYHLRITEDIEEDEAPFEILDENFATLETAAFELRSFQCNQWAGRGELGSPTLYHEGMPYHNAARIYRVEDGYLSYLENTFLDLYLKEKLLFADALGLNAWPVEPYPAQYSVRAFLFGT